EVGHADVHQPEGAGVGDRSAVDVPAGVHHAAGVGAALVGEAVAVVVDVVAADVARRRGAGRTGLRGAAHAVGLRPLAGPSPARAAGRRCAGVGARGLAAVALAAALVDGARLGDAVVGLAVAVVVDAVALLGRGCHPSVAPAPDRVVAETGARLAGAHAVAAGL